MPVFVLEFLLGKYCASSDEMAIQMGLQVVNDTLANNYIRPDESMKAQSKVKENGHAHVHRQGEGAPRRLRLLGRGRQLRRQVRPHPDAVRPRLRAAADGRRLGAGRHALRVRRGVEGQEPVLDRQARRRSRSRPSTSRSTGASAREFTTDEWLDLMVRSMGYEPAEMSRRLKLLFLVRLIPLARAQLQPRRARAARHRQELRRPGGLAVRGAAHGRRRRSPTSSAT